MRLPEVAIAALVAISATDGSAVTVELSEFDPGSGAYSTMLSVEALNYVGGEQSLDFHPSSLPFNDFHSADSGDGVVSEANYQFADAGFQIGLNQSTLDRSSATSSGLIVFALDQDAPYILAGRYSMTGWTDIGLYAELFDLTAGARLFENQQFSQAVTPDQAFYLGESEGTTTNLLSGSLEGSLLASHIYRLIYRMSVGHNESVYGQATASGTLSLAIVPEPATASLIGVGLIALAVTCRCRAGRRKSPRSILALAAAFCWVATGFVGVAYAAPVQFEFVGQVSFVSDSSVFRCPESALTPCRLGPGGMIQGDRFEGHLTYDPDSATLFLFSTGDLGEKLIHTYRFVGVPNSLGILINDRIDFDTFEISILDDALRQLPSDRLTVSTPSVFTGAAQESLDLDFGGGTEMLPSEDLPVAPWDPGGATFARGVYRTVAPGRAYSDYLEFDLVSLQAVPEPSSGVLFALGLAGVTRCCSRRV